MRKDITDVNPTIDDSHLLMANDLIFTSVGELIGGDKNDLHPWDIDLFDPVSNIDDATITDDKKVVDMDDVWDNDIFHGDNIEW